MMTQEIQKAVIISNKTTGETVMHSTVPMAVYLVLEDDNASTETCEVDRVVTTAPSDIAADIANDIEEAFDDEPLSEIAIEHENDRVYLVVEDGAVQNIVSRRGIDVIVVDKDEQVVGPVTETIGAQEFNDFENTLKEAGLL